METREVTLRQGVGKQRNPAEARDLPAHAESLRIREEEDVVDVMSWEQ